MFACRLLCSCDSDRNQLSEVVKPGDFEDKLKKRDDAFNKAIKTVPTEVQVKNEPVGLAQKLEKAVRNKLRVWSLMLGTSRNLKEFCLNSSPRDHVRNMSPCRRLCPAGPADRFSMVQGPYHLS